MGELWKGARPGGARMRSPVTLNDRSCMDGVLQHAQVADPRDVNSLAGLDLPTNQFRASLECGKLVFADQD